MAAADAVVPERYRGVGAEVIPTFAQVDFGLVRDADGSIKPKLVELQAFASLYGFQLAMAEAYRDAFSLPASLDLYLDDLTPDRYYSLVADAIVGDHDPAEVVLMEIQPRQQKTWPDFVVTEQLWGVRAVDTAEVKREGRRLYYRRDGRLTQIKRIYNRVIPDELERRKIQLSFGYGDELEVQWAGHPAWYFRLSKFSIPWLTHPSVPETRFLDGIEQLPVDRERYLLKPLFSFAGGGIMFAPTDAQIAAIPHEERKNYILQERIAFEPVIDDAGGPDPGRDPDHVRPRRRATAPGLTAAPHGPRQDDGRRSQQGPALGRRVGGLYRARLEISHPAAIEMQNTIGEGLQLCFVVGYVDQRHVQLATNPQHVRQDTIAPLAVDAGQRLVE